MKILKILVTLFSLYITTTLAAINTSTVNKKNAVLLAEVVAEVNEDIILSGELEARFNIIKPQLIAKGININDDNILKKKVLEQIILEKLQQQKAKQLGIKVSDEEVVEKIILIAKQNKMSLDSLRNKLNSTKNGFVKFHEQLRKDLVLQKLRQRVVLGKIQVSEEEIESIVGRSNSLQNWSYNLGHIMLVLPESSDTNQRKQLQQKIKSIRSRILQGEDFAQLAIRFSQGKNALQGGNLGWLPYDKIPTFFISNLAKLKVGEVSPIIHSPIGFHLIKLLDKRNGNKNTYSREKAIRIIKIRKANESIDLWLRQIRAQAFIDIKIDELKDK